MFKSRCATTKCAGLVLPLHKQHLDDIQYDPIVNDPVKIDEIIETKPKKKKKLVQAPLYQRCASTASNVKLRSSEQFKTKFKQLQNKFKKIFRLFYIPNCLHKTGQLC